MILVIGGAYMGKLSWVKKEYGIADADICDLAEGYEPEKKCYRHLESLTRRLVTDACGCMTADPDVKTEESAADRNRKIHGCDVMNRDAGVPEGMAALMNFPADAIIISREIGSGVVPVDASDRRWRDVHGSLLQKLSAECGSVYRICFGLAENLK